MFAHMTIFVLLASAFLIPIIGLRFKKSQSLIAVSVIIASFLLVVLSYPLDNIFVFKMSGWNPPFGIPLVIDNFSLFIALIITGSAVVAGILSLKKETQGKYWMLFLVFLAGLLAVVFSGDLFNMFVFIEVFSIAAYSLTISKTKESSEAAFKFLIIGSLAAVFILLGVVLLYGGYGTLNIADLAGKIKFSFLDKVALVFLLTGFFVKAAIAPFYAWKPDVITAVDFPVAILFTTALTSVGIYCIARILFTLYGFSGINLLLMLFGIITIVVGGILALLQDNIKRLIAYSSISQLGYVLLGLSFPLAIAAGLFHMLNNVIIKSLMLFGFGLIGKDDLNKISFFNPKLSLILVIGLLGITGVPPLNGFASKFFIYVAGFESGFVWASLIAIFASVITLAYYFKIFSVFKGKYKQIDNKFLIVCAVLALLCILLGIFYEFGLNITGAEALLNRELYIKSVLL